jgi:putative endonuclease
VKNKDNPRLCSFVGCKENVTGKNYLCFKHYQAKNDHLIDQCPSCELFKDAKYQFCIVCVNKQTPTLHKDPVIPPIVKNEIKIEHSKAWEKKDEDAAQFFVYILKLNDGTYYVGNTRELRERLSEHKDGKTKSTKGLNPKLQYFEILQTRQQAEQREVEIKYIYSNNERQLRRMMLDFKDWVTELSYD